MSGSVCDVCGKWQCYSHDVSGLKNEDTKSQISQVPGTITYHVGLFGELHNTILYACQWIDICIKKGAIDSKYDAKMAILAFNGYEITFNIEFNKIVVKTNDPDDKCNDGVLGIYWR